MPVREDPEQAPGGRLLVDREGRLLARFLADVRDDRCFADLFEPADDAADEVLVRAALHDLAGWRVACPTALGSKLAAAGGQARRHAHVMLRSLADGVPAEWERAAPPGVSIGPVECTPAELAPAMLAAHPPGHPDFEPGDDELSNVVARLERQLAGTAVGPLLPCSRLAVGNGGRPLGAALLTDLPARELPRGGPWLIELFREPGQRGLGAALLRAALWQAAADGHPGLGLTVTEGNSARGLYEATGFELASSWLNVDLPA